ncbi:hypothetical protein [Bradyrhizobium sp. S3.2.12]|uniref:hypothetical protein n=1 Tax=Bradyrhizobium sp. S3.2.12 TaxID=3156387 RepID=UPI003398FEAC
MSYGRRIAKLTTSILAIAFITVGPSGAIPAGPLGLVAVGEHAANSSDLIEVRAAGRRGGAAMGPRGGAVVHRGGGAVGPRGGAYHGRTVVRGPRGNVAARSTTVVRGRGGWARPGNYHWPRGGAIAAGAAIGFVSAATAAAWAGAAPAPGMCWYYTDPSRTQGFWDYCR